MDSNISYDSYLTTSLNGRSYHQQALFKELDLIEDSQQKTNAFVHFRVLHREEFKEYFQKNHAFFMESLPFDLGRFVEAYDHFQETYKAKNKNSRYAVQLRILYPKSITEASKRKAFIKEYMRQLIHVKQKDTAIRSTAKKVRWKVLDLPYTVEEIPYKGSRNKPVLYAVITIVERAYLGVAQYKIYKENKYYDKRTGRFAKRECPQEYKVLKCKKGTYQTDESGKPKANESIHIFSRATREFHYGKSKSGRDLFLEFIDMLKQKLLSAFKKVSIVRTIQGKVLHKRQNKASYANIVKRRIGMINYGKQTIEYTTNFLLQKEQEHAVVLDRFNPGKDPIVKPTDAYKKICNIFEKYRARFKKEEFHDTKGNLRKIRHCYQAVDELEANMRELVRMFFEDINKVQLS